jgi:hypothetical protein
MQEEQREKRRFPRVPAEHVVLVKKLGDEELEEFAKTMTVGLGGCMFVSDSSLGVGSGIEILMSVKGKVVQTQARVVYETPKSEREIHIGVEFLQLRQDDIRVLEAFFAEQADRQDS